MGMTTIEKFEKLPSTARILLRVSYTDPDKSPKTIKGGNEYGLQEILDHPDKIKGAMEGMVNALLFDYQSNHA